MDGGLGRAIAAGWSQGVQPVAAATPVEYRILPNGINSAAMRRVALHLITLLALLAILVSGGAAAGTQYLCHMTGRVVATCCCASEGPPHAARAAQQVRAADCCERIAAAAPASASDSHDVSSSLPGAPLAAILPPYGYAPLAAQITGVGARSARAPPAAGPPLFVVHCALLI